MGVACSSPSSEQVQDNNVFKPEKQLCPEDMKLIETLNGRNEMICVADPDQPDCPLVFVSPLFCRVTGHSSKDIVGKNCRFLQGERTDKKDVDNIRNAINKAIDTSLCLLNYRKDGTTFYNQFFMSTLKDPDGKLAYFIGVQQEVRSAEAGQDSKNFAYRFRRAGRYSNLTDERPDGTIYFKPSKAVCAKDRMLLDALHGRKETFVISDPEEQDNPIVYCSPEFVSGTGYQWEEIVGVNCRFLQGPRTKVENVETIRKAIIDKKDTSVCLLNYRKDGTTFWNQFFITPLKDAEGNVSYYLGVQQIVAAPDADQEQANYGYQFRNMAF